MCMAGLWVCMRCTDAQVVQQRAFGPHVVPKARYPLALSWCRHSPTLVIGAVLDAVVDQRPEANGGQ